MPQIQGLPSTGGPFYIVNCGMSMAAVPGDKGGAHLGSQDESLLPQIFRERVINFSKRGNHALITSMDDENDGG